MTEFDRQKHMNACHLLHTELEKLAEGIKNEQERAVHLDDWFTLSNWCLEIR